MIRPPCYGEPHHEHGTAETSPELLGLDLYRSELSDPPGLLSHPDRDERCFQLHGLQRYPAPALRRFCKLPADGERSIPRHRAAQHPGIHRPRCTAANGFRARLCDRSGRGVRQPLGAIDQRCTLHPGDHIDGTGGGDLENIPRHRRRYDQLPARSVRCAAGQLAGTDRHVDAEHRHGGDTSW